MKVQVIGGAPPKISVKGYQTQNPVYSTWESVKYLKQELAKRNSHLLSAVELKHDFSPNIDLGYRGHPHNSIYLIIDKTTKEVLQIYGMAKTYTGEGPCGALTIDTYLDLLNIPIYRTIFSKEMIERMKSKKKINTPSPRLPKFNLDNLSRIKRRANEAHLSLNGNGFKALNSNLPLEKILDLTDFENHGGYN